MNVLCNNILINIMNIYNILIQQIKTMQKHGLWMESYAL